MSIFWYGIFNFCFFIKYSCRTKIKPIKVYNKFKEDIEHLIIDQKEKTGVYCLVNLINGNIYIGSYTNIAMINYFKTTYLKKQKK